MNLNLFHFMEVFMNKVKFDGKSEFRKRCDCCKKYKKSRIYFMKINDNWMFLCSECWDKENEKREFNKK